MIKTIHELTLGVQKVYKHSSSITLNECGFEVFYNRNQIIYYILTHHDKVLDVIDSNKKKFNKIGVYSDIELPILVDNKFIEGTSTANKDNLIVYNNLTSKQLSKIRRAERFIKREGFAIVKVSKEKLDRLTDLWVEEKYKDERVFKMTFSPNRYKNASLFLEDSNYSFYNIEYKGELISSIAFYNKDDVSYQLTYASDSTITKIVNDQYELILWSAFNDRFKQGKKIISMGTSGGIKNLENFKKKFYTDKQSCYNYKMITETKKGLFD